MVSDVSGPPSKPGAVYDGTARIQPRPDASRVAAPAGPAGSGVSSQVSLTQRAERLQQLEGAVAVASPVDELRVEVVRKQVIDGTYEVEPERTADKLVAHDRSLPRAAGDDT